MTFAIRITTGFSYLLLLLVIVSSCGKKSDPTPAVTSNPGSTTTTTPGTTTVTATAPIFDAAVLSTIDAVGETSGQVSSTIKENGGAAITQHGHVYSETNQAPTVTDSRIQAGRNDGPFPAKFTNSINSLKANTIYYVRPFATNDKGTTYGSMVQFKTTSAAVSSGTKTVDCNNIPEVWEDLGIDVDYLVKCNISISSTKIVTIKPGVKIQFEGSDAGITINSQAALAMIGTKEKPIILEGKMASAGSWKGVTLNAVNIENRWEYVTIRHAGATQNAGFLMTGVDKALRQSVKNCTFSDNAGYGVLYEDVAYGSSPFTGFESNIFTNNTKSGIKLSAQAMGSLDSKSSYTNNGQKYVEVVSSAKLLDEMAIQKLDVPFRVLNLVNFAQKITFMPGVTIEFGTDAGFTNSTSDKSGSIIADGTAANPIRFVGYLAGTKALWKGIVIQGGSPETKFNYCIIDGAGSVLNSPCDGIVKTALSFGATPCGSSNVGRGSVTNCTISNSGGYGIVFKAGDPVTLANNTFTGNTGADVFNLK